MLAIALDPESRLMLWSDCSTIKHEEYQIYSAGMDGTGQQLHSKWKQNSEMAGNRFGSTSTTLLRGSFGLTIMKILTLTHI